MRSWFIFFWRVIKAPAEILKAVITVTTLGCTICAWVVYKTTYCTRHCIPCGIRRLLLLAILLLLGVV